MTHHTITGGGVQLHLVETGNPSGRPIVFIHGLSQCWLTWSRQLNSDQPLPTCRDGPEGHGVSEKPHDGYADARIWADDVNAVLEALKIDRQWLLVRTARDPRLSPALR